VIQCHRAQVLNQSTHHNRDGTPPVGTGSIPKALTSITSHLPGLRRNPAAILDRS